MGSEEDDEDVEGEEEDEDEGGAGYDTLGVADEAAERTWRVWQKGQELGVSV